MDYKDYQSRYKNSDFWFRAKKDLIKILMLKVCKESKNLDILNLGAGTGDDLKILSKYGNIYVTDIEKKALDSIKGNFYFEKRVADACNLPYQDNFFDIVVSFDVFEHIQDDAKAVSEVYRVLKKDGNLVFTVPAFQFLFSSHDKALEHKRRYSKKMLKALLSNFSDLKLNYWNSILFLPISALRLVKKKSEAKVDSANLPRFLNSLLYQFLKVDNSLVNHKIPLPFGLTILGYCRK